jgi:flagellar biosynthetic protein FliR
MITIPDPTLALLVLARVAGLVLSAPMLGHALVPPRVRAALAVLLAAAIVPALGGAGGVAAPASLWSLGAMVATESALGVLLGLVAQFVFAGVQLGGQIIGIQMGFGIVNLIDPQSHAQVTIIAEWQQLMALLTFLVLDVHHLLIRAVLESFRAAPPGGLALDGLGVRAAISLAGDLFVVGVRIAAPVLVVLLLTNGALGVLARTIPQLNVFVVGFPLNVGVGLLVLGAAMPFTLRLLAGRFAELEPALGALVRGLVHA